MRVISSLLFASVTLACSGANPLTARAAFDLSCPKEQLETIRLDERTYGVRGCGQKATYVYQCSSSGPIGLTDHCNWVLNNSRQENATTASNPGPR